MSLRTVLILVLALGFGGSAAVGVSALVGAKGKSEANRDTVRIVVAAVDVPRGGMITSDMVRQRDCPKDLVPLGVVTKTEDALNRAVSSPLVKDEPVLEGKLAPKGAGRGLAALVPKGMRAFTILTTNITSSVAGFILPGNRVDVLMTVSNSQGADDKTGGGSTTTLLQNVEIIAVDQKVDAPVDNHVDTNDLRSVTVLVTPDQASKLDLGQAKGTLHLSLRNLEDGDTAKTRPSTFNELRFSQVPWDERAKGVFEALAKVVAQKPKPAAETPPPALVAEAPRTVRVYRGVQWTVAN